MSIYKKFSDHGMSIKIGLIPVGGSPQGFQYPDTGDPFKRPVVHSWSVSQEKDAPSSALLIGVFLVCHLFEDVY